MPSLYNTWATPICPEDCDEAVALPAMSADPSCGIKPEYSQINWFYFTPKDAPAPFVISGETATATAGAIDNSDTTGAKTKVFYGQGGIDEPEVETYEGPGGQEIIIGYVYTLQLRIIPTELGVREALRRLQCGDNSYTFGLGDISDKLLYATGGIKPFDTRVVFVRGAGATDVKEAILRVRWKTINGDVKEYVNPL